MKKVVSLPPVDKAVDVSVVIVAYNSAEVLGECLRSLYNPACGLRKEVFLVDNASSDNSVALVQSQFPEVIIIANHENRWFAAANNQAIIRSHGRYILHLNPDTIISENALRKMSDFLDNNPNAGAVSVRLINPDGSLQPSSRNFLTNRNLVLQHILPWRRISKRLAGKIVLEFWAHDRARPVDWLLGACLMVRRETIEEVGLKDESFPMFYEEADWCYRIRQAGWRTWLIPDAHVVHLGGTSTVQRWGDKLILEYYKAKHHFILKHYGTCSLLLHRFLLSCLLLVRIALTCIAWLLGGLRGSKDTANRQRNLMRFHREALLIQLRGSTAVSERLRKETSGCDGSDR